MAVLTFEENEDIKAENYFNIFTTKMYFFIHHLKESFDSGKLLKMLNFIPNVDI